MTETLAVTFLRLFRRSGHQLDLTGSGHEQDIAQVRVSGAAEMRMAEAHDGGVVVLVAGAVFIGARLIDAFDVVGNHFCVGRELHAAEGDAGSGEGMPHPGGADKRIHILYVLGRKAHTQAQREGQKEKMRFHTSKINIIADFSLTLCL